MGACSIEGCSKSVFARGWCSAHYRRWKIYGIPTGGGTEEGKPLQWLSAAVGYEGDECLLFPYARDGNGYGRISVNGKVIGAHRYVCIKTHGAPTSSDQQAAHSCGNGHKGCVTPKHLRWATHKENHQDRIFHGTNNAGSSCGTSKLTEDIVRKIKLLRGKRTQRSIASEFNVTDGAIRAIFSGRTWRHV